MKYYKKDEVQQVMTEILIAHGVGDTIAEQCVDILIENSMDGIYSHGINRFPRLVSYLEKGYIKPENTPTCEKSLGAVEQWDGHLGMGNTNAQLAMDRAIALAKEHGVGVVAIRNTNHWMRGGTYGIQAAKEGCIGIGWTNTQPNMPAWGAEDRRIGNNPLIFAVPYKDSYVMIDAAMSQFSYGSIEAAKYAGRQLPVPGGFDTKGNMSTDPAEIEKTWRVLPIGYWKGSGFSILLDMIAAALSEGNTTGEVGELSEDEYSLSQVLIAIDCKGLSPNSDAIIEKVLTDVKASTPIDPENPVLYPSEKEHEIRQVNDSKGIPIDDVVWEQIQALRA